MPSDSAKKPDSPDDVEMKNVDSSVASPASESTPTEAVKPIDADAVSLEEIKEQAKQIEKSVTTKESRFVFRVLRSLAATRKKLNARLLRKIINGFYTHSNTQRDLLLRYVDEPMEVDLLAPNVKTRSAKTAHLPLLPELDVYFHLLVLLYLIDLERYEKVRKLQRNVFEL